MSEEKLKHQIGFFIVISNFGILILSILMYFLGAFLYDEMTTTVSLLVPMFSVYCAAIIKFLITNKNNIGNSDVKVSTSYVVISYAVPVLFVSYIVLLILAKSFSVGFSSFEQFKLMLIFGETLFGGYAGLILSSLFDIKIKKS